jgi:hypothetical protein
VISTTEGGTEEGSTHPFAELHADEKRIKEQDPAGREKEAE